MPRRDSTFSSQSLDQFSKKKDGKGWNMGKSNRPSISCPSVTYPDFAHFSLPSMSPMDFSNDDYGNQYKRKGGGGRSHIMKCDCSFGKRRRNNSCDTDNSTTMDDTWSTPNFKNCCDKDFSIPDITPCPPPCSTSNRCWNNGCGCGGCRGGCCRLNSNGGCCRNGGYNNCFGGGGGGNCYGGGCGINNCNGGCGYGGYGSGCGNVYGGGCGGYGGCRGGCGGRCGGGFLGNVGLIAAAGYPPAAAYPYLPTPVISAPVPFLSAAAAPTIVPITIIRAPNCC